MNYVTQAQKQNTFNSLKLNPYIDYKNLVDIVNAFQIASGQSFAIGSTLGILEFLSNNNSITVINFDNTGINRVINSAKDLDNIISDMDSSLSLSSDNDFKAYFI